MKPVFGNLASHVLLDNHCCNVFDPPHLVRVVLLLVAPCTLDLDDSIDPHRVNHLAPEKALHHTPPILYFDRCHFLLLLANPFAYDDLNTSLIKVANNLFTLGTGKVYAEVGFVPFVKLYLPLNVSNVFV